MFCPIIQNVTQKMRSNQGIQFVVGNVDTGSCTRKGQREVSFCQLGVMLLCIRNYYVSKGILWTKKLVEKRQGFQKVKNEWLCLSDKLLTPLTFNIWLIILPFSCNTFPCELVMVTGVSSREHLLPDTSQHSHYLLLDDINVEVKQLWELQGWGIGMNLCMNS